MSLVSKSSGKLDLKSDSEILRAILDKIQNLEENIGQLEGKKGSSKSKKKQKESVREEMRPDKVHIFPYTEGDEYVYIALIDKQSTQTAPVIKIEYSKMLELAKTISSLNPKQKCTIHDYQLTEDVALNIDGEYILSPS